MSEGSGVARAREEGSRSSSTGSPVGAPSSSAGPRSSPSACCWWWREPPAWAPSYFLVGNFDTYQLIINTPTTIIIFLLVALLQNTQRRGERTIQHKLEVWWPT